MTDFHSTLPRKWALALFALFAAVYFSLLPATVQTNDTGELVVNALGLHVIHPPGYPAYQWLYHLFLNLLPEGTPFFKAALLTSWLGAAAIAILALLKPMRTSMGVVLLAGLATSRIYMQYSALPDVFMLHLLICAGILFSYLCESSPRRRLFAMALLLGVGVANHHTVIFLAPLYFLTAWQSRSWRDLAVSGTLAVGIAFAFYASLFAVSSGHILDWKVLGSWPDLWSHFLRADYGTFQLSGKFGRPSLLSLMFLFVKTLYLGIPILLFGAVSGTALCVKKWREDGRLDPSSNYFRFLAVGAVLLLYIVIFFPLCNLPTKGFFVELLERFFLMPSMIVAVLGVLGLQLLWPSLRPSIRRLVAAAAVISLVFNVTQRDRADYSRDTLVEDYTMDLLNRAGSRRNSVLLTSTDSVFFASGYVQYALGYQAQVPVLFLGGAQRGHLPAEAKRRVPALNYSFTAGTQSEIEAEFLKSNLGKVTIFSMLPLATAAGTLRVHRVGYEVMDSPSLEPYFDQLPTTERTDSGILRGFGGRVSLRMHDLRCRYETVQADWKYKNKDFEGTLRTLEQAIAAFPICFPAQERRCQLLAERPELGSAAQCELEYRLQQDLYSDDYLEFSGNSP